MDLEGWLERIEQLHPRKWDLGLDRVSEVGRRLDILSPARTVFLVGGTNGKGSTCAAIGDLCASKGLSTGVSTSPHLLRFNERIVVDGDAVPDREICETFEAIDRTRGQISLTYFEFGALAAMAIFKRRGVDVAVLEIGLGGRLDAMNIVDPDVSVITRIAIDHESWLGGDRETIAREKAGIMRSGRPCVIADENPPDSLGLCVVEAGARPIWIGTDFGRDEQGNLHIRGKGGDLRFKTGRAAPLLPVQSLLAAIQAVSVAGITPSEADIDRLFTRLTMPARFQQIAGPRRTILDVAHNPDAARWLAGQLQAAKSGRCHAVVGMYRDKDYGRVLSTLAPLVDGWYLCDTGDVRSATTGELADCLAGCGGSVLGRYGKVSAAYDQAVDDTTGEDLILVFGSFSTVGGVLDYLGIPV